LQECGLFTKKVSMWDDDVIFSFVKVLRELSKPMVIAANKADIPQAEENIKRLREAYRDRYVIVPTCAEAELALRKAAKAGLIEYLPGDHDFKVVQPEKLTPAQVKALDYIRENVFKRWGSTGVQEALNKAIFDVLGAVAVFPVENEYRLTDHHGRVLPDAFLVRSGTTVRDFAGLIHSELKENFMHAIDVRTKKKLPGSYVIRHRDVIKIVTRK
ncbi:MAG: redox-regulated ATPase YchF, partial [Thermoprotei archaeon]